MISEILILDTETTITTEFSVDGSIKYERTPNPFHHLNRLVSIGCLKIPIATVFKISKQFSEMNASQKGAAGYEDMKKFMISCMGLVQYERVIGDTLHSPIKIPRLPIGTECLLVGQNLKFDLTWLLETGLLTRQELDNLVIWDTMLVEHLLHRGVMASVGLNAILEQRGMPGKEDEVGALIKAGVSPEDIDPAKLELYNRQDIATTFMLFLAQLMDLGDPEEVLLAYIGANNA